MRAPTVHTDSQGSEWEIVQATEIVQAIEARVLGFRDPRQPRGPGGVPDRRASTAMSETTKEAVDEILLAMATLPWPVPNLVRPDGRFATLCQISIG